MSNRKVQFSDILYNPELSAFQTRATIHEGGVAYVYPVHICAPLNAEFEIIAAKLAEKTRQTHDKRQTSLHMHHTPQMAPAQADHPWAA